MDDFSSHFGRPAAARADAPGRVNLLGEHTDYNGGWVLPVAIPQRTQVALAARGDRVMRAVSTAVDGPVTWTLGAEAPGRGWADYLQGCTAMLAADGRPLGGCDVVVTSDVPLGSGLASSAALTVAFLRALRLAFRLPLDDVQLALVAHRAEHDFVGARIGVMDQLAASLADDRTALFLDTRTLVTERVPLPPTMELVVIDSGVAHAHAGGDYNTRRAECDAAAAALGVPQLRDLGTDALVRVAGLPSPLDRRARHVVTENARVLAGVAALRAGKIGDLGALFVASHRSQRDDFAVSVPAVDALVDRACVDASILGARLTGGGFGGAIVCLAHAGTGRAAGLRIVAGLRPPTPRVLVPA